MKKQIYLLGIFALMNFPAVAAAKAFTTQDYTINLNDAMSEVSKQITTLEGRSVSMYGYAMKNNNSTATLAIQAYTLSAGELAKLENTERNFIAGITYGLQRNSEKPTDPAVVYKNAKSVRLNKRNFIQYIYHNEPNATVDILVTMDKKKQYGFIVEVSAKNKSDANKLSQEIVNQVTRTVYLSN